MAAKIALITGANKGIGFETARQLGTRGMTVLAGARDEQRGRQAENALREAGIDARFVQLDVTDPKSIRRAAEWIDTENGHLDVLVNNAGTASVARQGYPPSQTSLQDMRAVYEINVFGVVAVTKSLRWRVPVSGGWPVVPVRAARKQERAAVFSGRRCMRTMAGIAG